MEKPFVKLTVTRTVQAGQGPNEIRITVPMDRILYIDGSNVYLDQETTAKFPNITNCVLTNALPTSVIVNN
jgi:hypothetical protein